MQQLVRVLVFAGAGTAIALCGCTRTTGSQTAGPDATAPAPAAATSVPEWPKLPEGAVCTEDLQRFQTILKSDADTGNLNRTVYAKMQDELKPAAEACAEGRDAEARKILQATKQRHGYRA